MISQIACMLCYQSNYHVDCLKLCASLSMHITVNTYSSFYHKSCDIRFKCSIKYTAVRGGLEQVAIC